jgi:hypothetical protein
LAHCRGKNTGKDCSLFIDYFTFVIDRESGYLNLK